MKHCIGIASLLLFPIFGCAIAHDVDDPSDSAGAAGSDTAGSGSVAAPAHCENDSEGSLDGLPDHLSCTGLYANINSKKLSPDALEYTPGGVLWSDGADKTRWVILPEGKRIDASSPAEWVFPVGTKFFKEFAFEGRRVETRLFERKSDKWARTTYRWNEDETEAERSEGEDLEDLQVGGKPYHLPTAKQCDQCHFGRKERILGFEQIALGLDTAKGLTLADLVDRDLISPAPDPTVQIKDDGTGKSVEVIAWLHVNCGVSCHNSSPNADGHSTKLRMRLDAVQLAGPVSEYDVIKTTLGVFAQTPRWNDQQRIAPGDPENSLLYKLITSRGGGKNDQMPPIGTTMVDQEHADAVADWIRSMPKP